VQPGGAVAAISASSAGACLRLVGSHPKLFLPKSFPSPYLKVTMEPGVSIAGIDTNGQDGYVFDGITSVVPASTNIDASAFYVHGDSDDITLMRSKLVGGGETLKQYVAYPAWADRLKLIDSEVTGTLIDLIHINGAKDLLVEHNYLHDPAQDNSSHGDAFQIQRAEGWQVLRNTMEWDSVPKAWGPNQAMMVSRANSTDTLTNGVIANNLVAHWHPGRPLIISDNVGGLNVVNNTFVDSGDDISINVNGVNGPVANVFVWNNIAGSARQEGGATFALLDENRWEVPSKGNVQGTDARTGLASFVCPRGTPFPGTNCYDLTPSSPDRNSGSERAGTPTVNIANAPRVFPPNLGAW
jgi:hypothetical protein